MYICIDNLCHLVTVLAKNNYPASPKTIQFLASRFLMQNSGPLVSTTSRNGRRQSGEVNKPTSLENQEA
jgi:hypothetical protein